MQIEEYAAIEYGQWALIGECSCFPAPPGFLELGTGNEHLNSLNR